MNIQLKTSECELREPPGVPPFSDSNTASVLYRAFSIQVTDAVTQSQNLPCFNKANSRSNTFGKHDVPVFATDLARVLFGVSFWTTTWTYTGERKEVKLWGKLDPKFRFRKMREARVALQCSISNVH
jgi:hypothetical protein